MKKLMMFALVCAMLVGCAESKTFRKADGTEFTAEPYGWMNKDAKVDGVDYEVCEGSVLMCFLFSETIAAPLFISGLDLYEPVSYTEPKDEQ